MSELPSRRLRSWNPILDSLPSRSTKIAWRRGLLYTEAQCSLKSDNIDMQHSYWVASASVASGEAQNLLPNIVEYHFLGYMVNLKFEIADGAQSTYPTHRCDPRHKAFPEVALNMILLSISHSAMREHLRAVRPKLLTFRSHSPLARRLRKPLQQQGTLLNYMQLPPPGRK